MTREQEAEDLARWCEQEEQTSGGEYGAYAHLRIAQILRDTERLRVAHARNLLRANLDEERLDWLEHVLRGSASSWAEIYLAGLRNGAAPATAYQIESQPELFPTLNGPSLREAIDAARAATSGSLHA